MKPYIPTSFEAGAGEGIHPLSFDHVRGTEYWPEDIEGDDDGDEYMAGSGGDDEYDPDDDCYIGLDPDEMDLIAEIGLYEEGLLACV